MFLRMLSTKKLVAVSVEKFFRKPGIEGHSGQDIGIPDGKLLSHQLVLRQLGEWIYSCPFPLSSRV